MGIKEVKFCPKQPFFVPKLKGEEFIGQPCIREKCACWVVGLDKYQKFDDSKSKCGLIK